MWVTNVESSEESSFYNFSKFINQSLFCHNLTKRSADWICK